MASSYRGGALSRYAVAVAVVLVALAVRAAFTPIAGASSPYVTFYVAVVVVSLICGRGPAIVAMLCGAAAGTLLFVAPWLGIRISTREEIMWLIFYMAVCGTIIAAVHSQKNAAAVARKRLAELEAEQERRAAAEQERERARRWAAQTLSSIGDGVITTDNEGRVSFLNRVASELTGWTPEEATGKPIQEVFRIINEQTGQEIESPVARVLRESAVVGLANHTALIRNDGSRLPIDDSGAPILDETGATVGAVLVFRDYAERRRNEEANARLAAIVRFSHEAIISKSLDGIIQTWNPGAERLFGYTAAEAIGQPITILLPTGREHEESGILETVREGHVVEQFETVRRRKDGREVHVLISVSPLYDSHGEIVGVSHIAWDITVQKELQSQLLQAQKLESLGVLAGGVAHDFNNLLTGVMGSSSLLAEMLPEGSTEESLANQITGAAERAAHLTRQLLAYSGKGRFVIEEIDASATIREIVELLRASIPHTTTLVLSLADGLTRVEADIAQFQQVVMNLVINGAEAMGDAPGQVTVTTRSRYIPASEIERRGELADLKPGEFISIEVADTGCGMDAQTVARMFDPFFTTKFTGRGLGLAAVQGIVRGHYGAIQVESAPGRGTRIEVLLPVVARAKPDGAAPADGHPAVLVVDDEEVVRETARLSLERAGFHVMLADNGQQAVEAVEKHTAKIQLVLLDLTMPVLSGKGALERIRAIDPRLPVVLFSGYNEADAMRQINRGDVAGFLKKPFTADALKEIVTVALGYSAVSGLRARDGKAEGSSAS